MMTVDFILSDIQQRLARLIQVGVIASVNAANSTGTVTIGTNTSASLKIMQHRAGADVSYSMPSVGEQCLVFFPSGNMDAGFILPAIHSTANTPGAADTDIHRMTYADGTVIEYDQSTSTLTADCVGDVMIESATLADVTAPVTTINATTSATVTAPTINLTGTVNITGPLNLAGIFAQTGGGSGTFSGTISATEVTAGSTVLTTHTHAETGGETNAPS